MAKLDIYNAKTWSALAQQSGYDVQSLSRTLHISRRQLERFTQSVFGRSPREWLDEERLKIAAELLKEKRSVKAVAFDLGFKQSSHFSRKFKLYYGISPAGFLGLNARRRRLANPPPNGEGGPAKNR